MPSQLDELTDGQIMERWCALFKGPLLVQRHRSGEPLDGTTACFTSCNINADHASPTINYVVNRDHGRFPTTDHFCTLFDIMLYLAYAAIREAINLDRIVQKRFGGFSE